MPDVLASDPEAVQTLATGVLVAARLFPLTVLAPFLSLRTAPTSLSLVVTLALTVALTPVASLDAAALPHDLLGLSALGLRELLVGGVYALAVALPLHALEWGGRMMDVLRGAPLPGGQSLASAGPTSALGQLHLWLGVVLFLSLGGHHVVLRALAESFATLPVGELTALSGLSDAALQALRLFSQAFMLSVLIALPVALAMLASELLIAIIARGRSALPARLWLAPLRAGLAIAAVLLGLSVSMPHLPAIFSEGLALATRLLQSLSP